MIAGVLSIIESKSQSHRKSLFVLELKENLARMGSDLKQRIVDSVKYTWKAVNDFAQAHRTTPVKVEEEVDNVLSQMASTPEKDDDLACEYMPVEAVFLGRVYQLRSKGVYLPVICIPS